jgi:Flp pilus assembly protein TadD
MTLYTRTLAASPNAYYMHNNLGVVYWGQADIKSAEREWTEALRLAPNATIVLDNLALLNLTFRHYDESVGYSLRSLAADPVDPEAHLNLGSAYLEMGNIQQAEVELRAAVALAPLDANARAGLGELYLKQLRLPEAEEQFHRSLDSHPNLRAYVGLGVVRWRRGDRQEAERLFKEAESLLPLDPRPHLMLGLLYLDLGRNAEGEKELRKSLETDPTNEGALAALKRLKR